MAERGGYAGRTGAFLILASRASLPDIGDDEAFREISSARSGRRLQAKDP